MNISAAEVAKACNGTILFGNPHVNITSISTDSNKIEIGALFVPVIGKRVDSHRFISDAFANGASAAFSSEGPGGIACPIGGCAVISVTDTVKALQMLASYYRDTYADIPYVGVTGSVGKTTTREMTACALSASYNCYSTKGNANSQVGVPVTLCAVPGDAGIGVIEMGISEPGEMERLSGIVKCDAAIVTAIDINHIAQLKSRENIMREKLHILSSMQGGSALIINGDDDLLGTLDLKKIHDMGIACGREFELRRYGTGKDAYYRVSDIREHNGEMLFDFYIKGLRCDSVRLGVPGLHMVMDAAAALAASDVMGADMEKAAERLGEFSGLSGRGREITAGGVRIINDAYNASPGSMRAGIKVLESRQCACGGRHIAVLSDMLELGGDEVFYHRKTGEFIASQTGIDIVLAYGELSKNLIDAVRSAPGSGVKAEHFDSRDELFKYLCDTVCEGDVLLFKGSNSMKLESMAAALIERLRQE